MGILAIVPLLLGLTAGLVVVLALASIVFLSTVLIVAALMLRNKWHDMDDIRNPRTRRP